VFYEDNRLVDVSYLLIHDVDVEAVHDWIDEQPKPAAIFIEDYNPGNFGKIDKRMSESLGKLKAEFPPADHPYIVKYVDNAGVNTLLPTRVLNLFGVDRFPVATHHNDLVSAGKIALLGMLQDKSQHALRLLVSRVVKDALKGQPWDVTLCV
jgi:hypothetical protein